MTFRSSFLGPVIAAFLAVTLAFAAVVALSQYVARDIRWAVQDITVNATPGVQHVSELKQMVWRMQVDMLSAQGRAGLASVPDLLARIQREWRRYEATPPFSGEGFYRDRVAFDLSELQQQASAAMREPPKQAQVLIRQQMSATFARTAVDLHDLSRFNLRQGHLAALRAETSRLASLRIAVVLGTLTLVLAAILIWTVALGMRRLARLRAAHDRAMEERSADLEQFAARIAHDLRGPMSAALLGCELATRGHGLERVRVSIERMSQLLDGLYEFSRADSSQPGGRTSLREAILDAVETVTPSAEQAGLSLSVEDLPDVAVAASPGVLQSLMLNLLNNAIRHAGGGSRVTVRASVDERARVEVEDSGVGIPRVLQRTIFEPYVRSGKGQGLGLGLATVKRLVERHGGACGVRSAPESGSLFWFELPLARKDRPLPAGTARPERAHGGASPNA